MALSFSIGSAGFIARVIIAFIIIAVLYSRDRTNPAIKRGFVILLVLGVFIAVSGLFVALGFMAASGISFLGDVLHNFTYYHY